MSDSAGNRTSLVMVAVVAVAYAMTGRLGLLLADVQENTTLIWPPTGLSIGALVLFGPRLALGVFLGALGVNLTIGTPLGPGLGIAVGNTLEALAGWRLLQVTSFDPAIRRMRDVGLLVLCALSVTTISATLGIGSLAAGGLVGADMAGTVWLRWWLGDAAGAMLVAPLLTVSARGGPPWSSLVNRVETWLGLSLLTLCSAAAFLTQLPLPWSQLLLFGPMLGMVWTGIRLGPRGAVVGGAIASAFAVIGTAQGSGPFAVDDLSTSMLALWAFITLIGATALMLAAAITEREAALQQLVASEKQNRLLEAQMQHSQRLESLGVLAGGVAHDFNNLLTVVIGNASILPEAEDEAEREDLTRQILDASSRASDLCDQLLTYAGKAQAHRRSTDLSMLVDEMQALLRSSVRKNVELEFRFGAAVPPVIGDPALLQQVVLNLLMNGSEAIGEGAGKVTLSTELRECDEAYLRSTPMVSDIPHGEYVALTVHDDGEGIEPAKLGQIFEPFFTTKFAGRGLGLAATLGVVLTHDGAIKVSSKLGEGTTFTVLLPASDESPLPTETPARRASMKGRWLVVDDEPGVRSVARRMLESLGAQVVEAPDGESAIAQLDAEIDHFAGVLVDLTMPGCNGIAVILHVRDRRPDMPCVLMSGFAAAEPPEPGVAVMTKPFSMTEISTAVEKALARSEEV